MNFRLLPPLDALPHHKLTGFTKHSPQVTLK
jgi:hypothetical protein